MIRASCLVMCGANGRGFHRLSGVSFLSGAKSLPTVFQESRITRHESRNTAFPRHESRLFRITALVPCPQLLRIARNCPELLGYPPPANQVPPRTVAAWSSTSWMHLVAAQASPAGLMLGIGRSPQSRVTKHESWFLRFFPRPETRNTAFPESRPYSPSSRRPFAGSRLPVGQTGSRPRHASRDTKHESRLLWLQVRRTEPAVLLRRRPRPAG